MIRVTLSTRRIDASKVIAREVQILSGAPCKYIIQSKTGLTIVALLRRGEERRGLHPHPTPSQRQGQFSISVQAPLSQSSHGEDKVRARAGAGAVEWGRENGGKRMVRRTKTEAVHSSLEKIYAHRPRPEPCLFLSPNGGALFTQAL